MNLENISANTGKLLKEFSGENFMKDYTLVGGTALSLQIAHRLSEDLDFIFDGKFIDAKKIRKFIDNKFGKRYKLLKQDDDHQLDFLIDDIRVTFFSTDAVLIPFNVLEYSVKYGKTNIANLDILSVLKLNAILNRNTIRDYYDLYYIVKNYIPLNELFTLSRKLLTNLPEIVYSETITYSDDIEENSIAEHLNPKEEITKIKISEFFTKEIKKKFNN